MSSSQQAGLNRRGRPAGTPNRVTGSIKAMIEGALKDAGGREYLARQAEQNPVAFMGLVGRVLPLQLAGADGGALVVDFRWADAPQQPTIDASVAVDTSEDTPHITFIGEC
jgi:hypothetical protein